MIRAVISDLGRVILFFDNRIFLKKIAACSPLPEDKLRELVFVNRELIELFDSGKISPGEFFAEVRERLQAKITFEEFVPIYCDVFSLNPPVLETLKKLKGKVKLVLLSNTDILRFTFIKEKFPQILFFDEYVLSYEVGFMKPHPQIYSEAMKKAKSQAEECLFIDDLEENVQAACRLGINGLIYSPEIDLEPLFRKFGLLRPWARFPKSPP